MRKSASVVIAALLAALLAPLGPLAPASAAPGAPVITAPAAGASNPDNPVLGWNSTSGAVKYDVQVSPNSDFSGTLSFTQTTANTRATPPNDLPVGDYYWRVRATDSTNASGPFAQSTFTKAPRNAPVAVSPVDDAALVYPRDPLFFQWNALAGAKGYEIQIDDDSLFVGAPAPIATTNLNYAPTTPPVFGNTFWWRVRAKSSTNVYSQWSTPRSYSMAWGATPVTLVSPPSTNTPSIEEVTLDWAPMAGAAHYEIQVSPDANFNNPVVRGADNTRGRKVVSTRFSDNDLTAADALNLPAGAYYWRVRAMSTSLTAEPGPWSATWTFTRSWPGVSAQEYALPNGALTAPSPSPQVTLLAPAHEDYGLTEPRLSWTPQRGASNYEVQFSSDSGFSPSRVASCYTNHTTITPFWRVLPNPTTSCQPRNALNEYVVRPGVVAYWRVRALDGPETPANNGQFTPSRSFLYEQTNLVQLSPADGASVSVPVLKWTRVDDIALYKVTLQAINPPVNTTCAAVTAYTYNTTYVPETLSDKCSQWQWTVQGLEDNNNNIYSDGFETRIPLGGWRTFTWNRPAASAALPSPVTEVALAPHLPPKMAWPAVTGATRYQVYFSRSGANSFSAMSASGTNATEYAFTGSASIPLGRLLSPGDYDYFVRAISATNTTVGDSPLGGFHIDPMPPAALTAPAHCPLGSCTSVEYDTPTFKWNSVAGAGLYILYLARDPDFTNITHEFRTVHTQFTPAESLPDSQAGQATYWYVRACYMPAECAPFDSTVFGAARAFRKQSVPVVTEAPVNGYQETSGEVRFAWKDYLFANQAKGVTQEAAWYQVQVSTTENFTNVIETSPKVDSTEYTADLKTYPDGPLYWRVQAFDNSTNPLTFSTPIAFSKKLAAPTGLTPAGNTIVASAPLLKWDAMAYSGQYEVEIYKNPGDALSPTNRVVSITTRSTSAIPLTPLAAGQYGWRVRRIDPNGLSGSWSAEVNTALSTFTVQATKPVLISPAQGSTVANTSLLFSWTSVPGATRYKVEASSSDTFSGLIESVTTDLTSWAPGQLTPAWPNGTIYWRVTALDSNGAALAVSTRGSFTRDRSTAGEFTAVSPYRVLDTRATGGVLGAGQTRTVTMVGGSTGIPSTGVSAIVLNATVVAPTAASYLTLYPGGTRPTVSSLNWTSGQTIANHVTVPVSATGAVTMYNAAGKVHVLLDVVGYYSNGALGRGARYTPTATPTRIADTRGGGSLPHVPLGSGQTRPFEVVGLAGVPAAATAVVMNVTAVSPTKAGYFTVFPTGQSRPTASSLNFPAGRNVPNLVTMPIGAGGDVSIFNASGSTDVILDVVGWYQGGDPGPGSRLNSVAPTRIVDTRQPAHAPQLTGGVTRSFQVRGVGGIPNDAKAIGVVLNVTVVAPAAAGYATVFPSGTAKPNASNLNFVKGQTVPNQVIARIGTDGKVSINSTSSTNVLFDVVGWLG